ncbi:hypothetical protein [Hyalangium gracile]|nr:hypothetical protein [Hyalangium gracile]
MTEPSEHELIRNVACDVVGRRDGTFRIETTNRGEAVTRRTARL